MKPQLSQYSQVKDTYMEKDNSSSQSPKFSNKSSNCCQNSPNSADFLKNNTKKNSFSLIKKNGEKNSHLYAKIYNKNILEKISDKSKRIAKVKIFFGQKCFSNGASDCEKETYENIDLEQPKS